MENVITKSIALDNLGIKNAIVLASNFFARNNLTFTLLIGSLILMEISL